MAPRGLRGPALSGAAPSRIRSTRSVVFLAAIHVGGVAALWFASWGNLGLALVLYFATGFGASVGYHRLVTHRAFEANRVVEAVLAVLGALALLRGPVSFAATHRRHHRFADDEGDPHDIGRGLWHAHVGWVFERDADEVEAARLAEWAPDVARHPVHAFLERNPFLPSLVLSAILLAAGGVGAFLWGMCARVILGLHAIWLVNSVCHCWGARPHPDVPGTNNAFVAWVSFGEGWHNNHHARPSAARFGTERGQFDIGWVLIAALARAGAATGIRR